MGRPAMEPGVNSGPPRILEAAVMRLIPPLAREEVAGDLWERYRSPAGYLADALRVLPFTLWRQLRRASDGPLVLLLGVAMYASFGGLWPGRGEIPALVATGCCLGALLLRDAYRSGDGWTFRRALGDALALLAGVLVARSLVTLPIGWAIGGFVFPALLMLLLRSGMELTNTGGRLRMAMLADPDAEFRALARNMRLRASFETAVFGLLGGAALWFGLIAQHAIVSVVAGAWASPTLLLVGWRLVRGSGQGAPRQDLITELERQRRERQFAWWWLAAPLFAGLALNTVLALQRPGAALSGVATGLMLAGLLVQLAVRRRELIGGKITQLKDLAAN